MERFKRSVLVALVTMLGLGASACTSVPEDSSASDRYHTEKMLRVVDRLDGPARKFNQ